MTAVCLVTQQFPPDTLPGGIGTYASVLADGLAEAGCAVTVISRRRAGSVKRERRGNVVIWRVPSAAGRSLVPNVVAWPLAVQRFLRVLNHRFDVVEYPSWGGEGAFIPSSVASVLAVRLVTTLRTVRRFSTASLRDRLAAPAHGALESAAIRRATLRISGTAAHARSVAAEFGVPLASISIVPFGVRFPPRTSIPEASTILIVGRLEPRKGTELALQAAARVVRSMPEARFIFAGEIGRDRHGTPYQEIVRRDQALRLAVKLLGPVDDGAIQRLRGASKIILVPSLSESFGLTYLEAMAAGRPLVAFDIAASREVLAAAPIPLVPPNADALAEAIMRLLGDDVACERLGAAGRDFVRERYAEERMVAGTLEAYRGAGARAA